MNDKHPANEQKQDQQPQYNAPPPQYYTPPPQYYAPPPQYYTPYVKPQRIPYSFTNCDAAYACFAMALGFLVYEWRISSSLGTFLIIIVALIGTLLYINSRGVKQSAHSLVIFIICIAGALPFVLYDRIPINAFLFLFTIVSCFYWVLVSAGNSVEKSSSGYILADWVNQIFVIPFSNFLGLFISIKTASKDNKRGKSMLIGIIGVCITIPLIIGVTSLLINSDEGFRKFSEDFLEWLGLEDIGRYLLQFIGGIPIAMYIFGAVCGNIQKRYTGSITKESVDSGLASARRIPRPAILAPLSILCVLYFVYIAVMSVYLFSAFAGNLPEGFTYAEYARNGFFELCGVAAINLFVIIFTYSFAKRAAGEHPRNMRILTAVLCLLTELLVVTAVSKMLMYIDAYGLSRLRVYVLWFLVLLFVVFLILLIWHIRPVFIRQNGVVPFNAGRPLVAVCICFLLALFLANTDGIIAKYNVWQYQSGKSATVDTYMLSTMSDAVIPHLFWLSQNAKEDSLREDAVYFLSWIKERHESGDYIHQMLPEPKDAFRDWSLQSAMYDKYLENVEFVEYDFSRHLSRSY